MKNFFKRLLAGVAIGAGSAVPGVSGGTIAVLFKVYEKLVWAISNIFKEFKKAFLYLLPIVIGLVIGIIPMVILMNKALEGFTFGIICIFAGYIIGSFPLLKDEIKEEKPVLTDKIFFVVALLFAISLGILSCFAAGDVSNYFNDKPIWFYFVLIPVGLISSTALVVPGISGGMILIILGFYRPLIDSTVEVAKECLSGDWSNLLSQFLILLSFGIGVILGFFLTSKLMHFLLGNYRITTFYAIIGFVLGGVIALFFNFEIYSYYLLWASGGQGFFVKELEIPIGIALLLAVTFLSYSLSKYQLKQNKKEITNEENNE